MKMSKWLFIGFFMFGLGILPSLGASGSYHTYKELTDQLRALEKSHSDLIELVAIGKSQQGRDIWAVRLSNEKKGDPDRKSALFLTANLEADHLLGSEIALGTIEFLVNNYAKDEAVTRLLDEHTCYVVPRVNVDGAELFFAKTRVNFRTNLTPTDDDHDGLVDEDPCEDLNHDGLITMMRVVDPEGEYCEDPADGRILKKADRSKGEVGRYKLYWEGIDNDHDGEYNEDWQGGVNINNNFPHAYPYYQKGAGAYMTSESETRAVLDFLLAHRNVVMALSYSLYDNLINTPKPERSRPQTNQNAAQQQSFRRMFGRARKPATAIHRSDLPFYELIGKKYRELLGINKDVELETAGKPRGAFHDWAYFQYGILSLTTTGWTVPKVAEGDSAKTQRSMRRMMGAARSQQKKPSRDMLWLKWIDQKRNGKGFVKWEKVPHPDLHEVEVGGFAPYIKMNPPPEELPGLIEKHARFFASLGDYFPSLEIAKVDVVKKAEGVYTIEVVLRNNGRLPMALQQGVQARAVKPVLVRLEGKNFDILAGNKIEFVPTLEGSGGTHSATWVVQAKPGTTLKVTVKSEKTGDLSREIKLR